MRVAIFNEAVSVLAWNVGELGSWDEEEFSDSFLYHNHDHVVELDFAVHNVAAAIRDLLGPCVVGQRSHGATEEGGEVAPGVGALAGREVLEEAGGVGRNCAQVGNDTEEAGEAARL